MLFDQFLRNTAIVLLFGAGFSCNANAQQTVEDPLSNLYPQVTKASQFLLNQQLESGAFQDSTNALFNVWETVLVCDALLNTYPKDSTFLTNALKWLQSCENKNGLICHNSACSTSVCLETSSLYLRLLHRSDPTLKLTQELNTMAALQEANGSWKVGNPDVQFRIDFPSVTGFCVNTFQETGFYHYNSEKAFAFLAAVCSADSAWGTSWEYYGTPAYAIWQCYRLLPKEQQTQLFQWIAKQQQPDGSWSFSSNANGNHISPELETAFILNAIGEFPTAERYPVLTKGAAFLVQKQLPNGAWEGGLFPIPNQRYKKYEYLITTALALNALNRIHQRNIHE